MDVLYLCTGENITGLCHPDHCYLNGGECAHTMDVRQAKNPSANREFAVLKTRDGEALIEIEPVSLRPIRVKNTLYNREDKT